MTTIVYNLIGSLVDQTQPLGYKIDANALKLYDYFTLPVCKNKLTSDELSICKNKREKSTRTPIWIVEKWDKDTGNKKLFLDNRFGARAPPKTAWKFCWADKDLCTVSSSLRHKS